MRSQNVDSAMVVGINAYNRRIANNIENTFNFLNRISFL